jgi:hypothetical protein
MFVRSFLSWRNAALLGGLLIVTGVPYFFVDGVVTYLPSEYFDYFGIGILAGVLLLFVSLIGWAKQHGRQERLKMATVVFLAPCIAAFFGYLADGLNVHGSAGLIFLLAFPAIILTVILLIMAAAANQN